MSEWEELLKQHGYIMEDVDDAFKAIEERIKNKKTYEIGVLRCIIEETER